ncbi:MAG TPA: hypothetical protein VLC91_01110 [Spongiibacteraceae bacterium]|nr:hypothetical protein [Spongiibacteraceae bacterium]
MRKTLTITMLALSAALPAFAQISPQQQEETVSQAGNVTKTQVVKMTALVVDIDKKTRTLTLKQADGQSFDIVAGDEVRNFAQIKLNDEVVVDYVRSVSMALKKVGADHSSPAAPIEAVVAARAKPGEKPAAVLGRSVSAVAEVIDVDPAAKTMTLRGPRGHIVVLDVKNPDHFKLVKEGDQVQVDYTEAVAISVQPKA